MVTTAKNTMDLKVVKRDGKKANFNEEKIAVAIKKGFDSVTSENYTEEDTNKVFLAVVEAIKKEYKTKRIKISRCIRIIFFLPHSENPITQDFPNALSQIN